MGKRIRRHPLVPSAPQSRAGFSLVEVTILAILLLVAVGGLSGAVLSSVRLSRTSEESAIADEATRALAGTMQSGTFNEVFVRYNAVTIDDPAAATGPSPGAAFDVRGLAPRSDDADGRVGRIVFPSTPIGADEVLREDFVDERMGLSGQTDLNNDGDVTDVLKSGYVLLPVRLIVEWTGAGGDRTYELDLFLEP